jgi:hypothetical protein
MMENVAITFSMYDKKYDIYKIANSSGDLKMTKNAVSDLDESCYTLQYCFKLKDTNETGVFIGEFVIDFLGENCGKIKLPNGDDLQIIIKNSITKI